MASSATTSTSLLVDDDDLRMETGSENPMLNTSSTDYIIVGTTITYGTTTLDFVEFGTFESSCNSSESSTWPESKLKTNKRKLGLTGDLAIEVMRMGTQDVVQGPDHIVQVQKDSEYVINCLI
ncbi:unnamed protein product, partial [Rotaria sp. Silwood2]